MQLNYKSQQLSGGGIQRGGRAKAMILGKDRRGGQLQSKLTAAWQGGYRERIKTKVLGKLHLD